MADLPVRVRPATDADSMTIWRWRNDPDTRAASVNVDEVSWADHERWFARTLASKERHLLVGEHTGQSIGIVRFDAVEHPHATWEISINLAPEARGQKLSVPLLEAGREWLGENQGAQPILALIRRNNSASLRAFQRAGYVTVGQETKYITMLHSI